MTTRKCKNCKTPFEPRGDSHVACSLTCALAVAKKALQKKADQEMRRRRDDARPKSYWKQKAQSAFNAYIRHRDRMLPCISCGRYDVVQWHCGHYRSRKAQPGIAMGDPLAPNNQKLLAELNASRQCSQCNGHDSGRIVEYRLRLLERHGPEVMDFLERDHPVMRWTVDDYKRIADYYRTKLREAQDDREQG